MLFKNKIIYFNLDKYKTIYANFLYLRNAESFYVRYCETD